MDAEHRSQAESDSLAAPPDPAWLHRRILECARDAAAVDVRAFELQDAMAARDGLIPRVLSVLRSALLVCQDTLEAYDVEPTDPQASIDVRGGESSEGSPSSVFQIDEDIVVRPVESRRRLADVAFLGVAELRPRLARLEYADAHEDSWEIVADCGSALRRVEKTLIALERALCLAEGRDAELRFSSRLSRSLEVRQHYAKLRRVILSCDPPEKALHGSLRLVGTAIAVLIGKDVYPHLRSYDRRELRALQGRILAWLRADSCRGEALREGMRLWQDIVVFAGLLALVSRRQELVEHDAGVVARAHAATLTYRAQLSAEVLAELAALRGLDDELDALFDRGEQSSSAWRPILRRLHTTFFGSDLAVAPSADHEIAHERTR